MDSIGYAPPRGDDGNQVLSSSRSGRHFHHELSMIETTDDEATRGALSAQSQAGWQSEQNALSAASLKALQKELPVSFIMSQTKPIFCRELSQCCKEGTGILGRMETCQAIVPARDAQGSVR
eukprot:5361770-Amphidinium_carterae.1